MATMYMYVKKILAHFISEDAQTDKDQSGASFWCPA